jgi:hypothetical protein
MFHKELVPSDVSRFVFSEMKAVLRKMLLTGFDISSSPSHSCSVYLIQKVTSEGEAFGLGRSEPYLLSDHSQEVWKAVSLFELDTHRDDNNHPIAGFIGFITDHPTLKDLDTDLPTEVYVGVLVSPTGEEMCGHYLPLKSLEGSPRKLWEAPEDVFPFLSNDVLWIDDRVYH